MKLTQMAMRSSRLTLFAAAMILIGGIVAFLGFPSQEEPSVTVRDTLVSVAYPGMPSEQVENLLARPVEERLREFAGIKRIVTTVHPGSAIVQLTAYDDVQDLPALWQRVRAKAAEAGAQLPAGTLGPFVDDDFGRVSVASIAVTATGFSMSEMRAPLRRMREQLYALPGVEQVKVYGLQDEAVYVSFDRARLLASGLTPASVMAQLRAQNVVGSGGQVAVSGLALTVATSGEIRTPEQLRGVLLSVPGAPAGGNREVTLGELAQVQVMPT
ncbi:efflux RND transporter permease subunit, partial [Xanthomonas phaseoli]